MSSQQSNLAVSPAPIASLQSAKLCYTKQEVMALLDVSSTTYHKILKSGDLRSYRLYPGGPRRHSPQHVADYLELCIARSNPQSPTVRKFRGVKNL